MSEEISVTAAIEGRHITLDPLFESDPIVVPARRVESTIPCGFQVNWAEGSTTLTDGTEVTFDINCGAGCGSRWMTFAVKDANGEIYAYECIKLDDLLQAWFTRIERDGRTQS